MCTYKRELFYIFEIFYFLFFFFCKLKTKIIKLTVNQQNCRMLVADMNLYMSVSTFSCVFCLFFFFYYFYCILFFVTGKCPKLNSIQLKSEDLNGLNQVSDAGRLHCCYAKGELFTKI